MMDVGDIQIQIGPANVLGLFGAQGKSDPFVFKIVYRIVFIQKGVSQDPALHIPVEEREAYNNEY
jgi:hypothetical protein